MKRALSLCFALLIGAMLVAQEQTTKSNEQSSNAVYCLANNNSVALTSVSKDDLLATNCHITESYLSTLSNETPEPVYRRSSLYTILLETDPVFKEEDEKELAQLVMESYSKAPFPEKYNDHRLGISVFKFKDYLGLSAEELQKLGDENDEKQARKLDEKYIAASDKFLKDNEIAKGMVAKWFNRKNDGTFDMSLIHERGSYDASAMQVQLASGSIRGMSILQDAGEELIKNTFVVINRMRFVKNEPIARAIRDIAYVAAGQIKNELGQMAAKKAADIAYNLTKEGYSVWTVSFLYQLEWDDDIANNFYENMWMDESNISDERKALFENADIFKLKFVGFEKSKSLVLIGAGKSKEEIIQVATVRNIDRTYVKLQKSFDVFKTKTPIVSVEPITAKIGMKEGVEGGTKFDVLEMTIDSKTGLTKYIKIGQVKADGKKVWDNRYALSEDDVEANPEAKLTATTFKGGKKMLPGMLLRQVK